MKRILGFLATVIFLVLFPVDVGAYETINCQGFHYAMFDSGANGFAVLKDRSATLLVMPEVGLTSNYQTYVNYSGSWINTGVSNEVYLSGVSFSDTNDYRIAAFFKSTTGGIDYYCSNVIAQVFETEGVQLSSWMDDVQTAFSPTSYVSPNILSISGSQMAGLQYELTGWSCGGGSCFHHVSAPSAAMKAAGNGVAIMGYIYSSGMKSSVNFTLEPGTGIVQGKINNVLAYTRALSSGPPPPPPPPEEPTATPTQLPSQKCSLVYGYVRRQDNNAGIGGARVRSDKVDNSVGACLGGHASCGEVVTSSDGYWSVGCSGDVGCAYVIETTNAYGYMDGTKIADVPVGASAGGVNDANWNNPPIGVCGPFVFYDVPDPGVPTATPTPAPISFCPVLSSQEDGVGPEGLGTAFESVGFTAPDTGYVDRLDVKVANNGGAARLLTCKVTSSDGLTDVPNSERSVLVGGSSAAAWRVLDYNGSEFFLTSGVSYRLACKSSDDTNNLVWIYNNITNGVIPNGKTYKIYECLASDPILSGLVITNSVGTTVVAEAGARNQICDSTYFWDVGTETGNVRKVVFEVTIDDGIDGDNIDDVRIGFTSAGNPDYFRARAYNLASSPAMQFNPVAVRTLVDWFDDDGDTVAGPRTWTVGSQRVVTFPVEFHTDFADDIYDMQIYALNLSGGTLAFVDGDTARDMRIWDCGVDVSGTFFDASDGGLVQCATNTGFETEAESDIYSTLTFWPGKLMNKIGIGPSYEGVGTSAILLGQDYITTFVGLGTESFETRLVNLDTGTTSCVSQGFNLTGEVDGYQFDPKIMMDFAAVLDQESWWQVLDSGVNAKSAMENSIPATCAVSGTCRAAVAIGNTSATVGSVGPLLADNMTNLSVCDSCEKVEGKDWFRAGGDMVANNYSYDYLYQNYVYRLGLGVTYVGNTSMATIVTDTGGAGVVFVDGSLTVDDSNSLGANDFLMVVVAGNISVGVGTSQMAGVFLTDGDFVVSGDVDSQLVIKGLVYANGDISLGRSYLTGGLNNTSPGVRVEYDPSLIFKMPGNLIDPIILWKEGT